MANKVTHGDLAAFDIASGSQLDFLKNVRLAFSPGVADGSSILSAGEREEVKKKGATITASLMSTVSASRVSNLNLSAFSIDGVSYLSYLKSGNINYSVPNQESKGVASLWAEPQPMPNRRRFEVTCSLMVPRATATANALRLIASAILKNADPEDHQVTFTATINSVAFTWPAVVKDIEVVQEIGDFLLINVTLGPRAPISGTFPTDPSGTTSLLEKAINQADTALAFVFTPHDDAGYGTSLSGNMVISGVRFGIEDAQIIMTEYTYLTTGAIGGSDT